jgi:hypothetical protein
MMAKQRAALATLNENIADMTRTANRIGERDNWQGELYDAISRDLKRWRRKRDRLVKRVA